VCWLTTGRETWALRRPGRGETPRRGGHLPPHMAHLFSVLCGLLEGAGQGVPRMEDR
jgi:hypothetical protein